MNRPVLFGIAAFINTLVGMERLSVVVPERPLLYQASCMHEIIDSVAQSLETLGNERAVAIIDLDFTLLMANSPHGHPKFFKALVEFLQKNRGMKKEDAHNYVVMEVFSAAPKLTTIQRNGHDEGPDAHLLVQLFHDRHIPVFAVTSRSTGLSTQTMAALTDLGFTFTTPENFPHEIEFTQETFPFLADNARFCDGVLFCGKNKKGPATSFLLKLCGLAPTLIFAVDDDLGNLENIAQTMYTLPARTQAYRYGFLDKEIQEFRLTTEITPRWALDIPVSVSSVEQFPTLYSPLTSPGPSSYPNPKSTEPRRPATHQ